MEFRLWGLSEGRANSIVNRSKRSGRGLLARVSSYLQLARTRHASDPALREEAHTLESLNGWARRLLPSSTWRAVQAVTDAATELSGREFGSFFYNVLDEGGGRYMLYTFSGVPRRPSRSFPMPRATALFGADLQGRGHRPLARRDGGPALRQEQPHYGMPGAICPCAAISRSRSISRSGEVLGGLFFGHHEAGVFTERAERFVRGIAAQAAIAIDNARLYRAAQTEIAERKRTEAALRESEARFRNMADHVPVMVWVSDPTGACTYLSRSWYEFSGQTEQEALGFGWLDIIHPEDRERAREAFATAHARQESVRLEYRLRRADGAYAWAIDVGAPRRDEGGEFHGHVGSVLDITERKRIEDEREQLVGALSDLTDSLETRVGERTEELAAANRALMAQIKERERAEQALRQAQKMEAIGQLTGGVAHDFNNLLTIIIGNLETLERHLAKGAPDPARLSRAAGNALRGAQRAAALTQRLLAFSRRQPLSPRPIDANKLIAHMSELLRRTPWRGDCGRDRSRRRPLAYACRPERAGERDPQPRDQCARRNAGRRQPHHRNGEYLSRRALCGPTRRGRARTICGRAISDTGTGMGKDVLAQAFEPFFTTKETGKAPASASPRCMASSSSPAAT